MKIGTSIHDKYQKVCRYIKALEDKKTYDIRALVDKDAKPLPIQECQAILQNHVSVFTKNPNFYYINSFVTFVYEQLIRLEKSRFLEPDQLER